MLMNHDIGLEKSYFKPTVNDLLEGSDKMPGYIQIMNAVTINEENRLSKQIQELKEKNEDKDSIINGKLQEKESESIKYHELEKRYERDMNALREDMENKFQVLLSKIELSKLL